MLLEDASSRSLSSVDFGRAAQEAAANPKGLALPPPTEFIRAPSDLIDTEAALQEARRERASLVWRARVQLRRVSEIARQLARRTLELLPKAADDEEDLPLVEVDEEIGLIEDDEADTARTPTPVPFPAARREEPKQEKQEKPEKKEKRRPPSATQWEVTTQIVDMTKRKKGMPSRPGIQVSDLVLDDDESKD